MQSLQVSLDQLLVDPTLQPRVAGLDPRHVAELEQTGPESWPPIKVARQNGRYFVVDGQHRVAAAQNLAAQTIAAEVLDMPADADWRSLAFSLNAIHGRPLLLDDRRAEARRLLVIADLSHSETARRVGLSLPTVIALAKEVAAYKELRDMKPNDTAPTAWAGGPPRPRDLSEPFYLEETGEVIEGDFQPHDRRTARAICEFLRGLLATMREDWAPEWPRETSEVVRLVRAALGTDVAQRLGQGLRTEMNTIAELAAALEAQQ